MVNRDTGACGRPAVGDGRHDDYGDGGDDEDHDQKIVLR